MAQHACVTVTRSPIVQAYTPGGARRDADAYAPDLASVPDFKAFRKVAHAGGRRARRAFAPERDYYETLADTEAFLRCAVARRCPAGTGHTHQLRVCV